MDADAPMMIRIRDNAGDAASNLEYKRMMGAEEPKRASGAADDECPECHGSPCVCSTAYLEYGDPDEFEEQWLQESVEPTNRLPRPSNGPPQVNLLDLEEQWAQESVEPRHGSRYHTASELLRFIPSSQGFF